MSVTVRMRSRSKVTLIRAASEQELQRIVHIGPERAAVLVSLRPYTSVTQLTRINGIGEGRLRDIVAEGIACV